MDVAINWFVVKEIAVLPSGETFLSISCILEI